MVVKYSVVSIPTLALKRGLPFVTEPRLVEERYKGPLRKIEGKITGDPDKYLPVPNDEEWRVGWLIENKEGVPWFYLQLKKDRAILIYPEHELDSIKAMFSVEEVKEYFEMEFKDAPELEYTMTEIIPF